MYECMYVSVCVCVCVLMLALTFDGHVEQVKVLRAVTLMYSTYAAAPPLSRIA